MEHIERKKKMLFVAKNVLIGMKSYHKNGKRSIYLGKGLCDNILYDYDELYECKFYEYTIIRSYLKSYFLVWKHYSGNPYYPINSKGKTPPNVYYTNGSLYKGRKYKMRKKLIKHIIRCLKYDIKNNI